MVKKTKTKKEDVDLDKLISVITLLALDKEINKPKLKWYTTLATFVMLGFAIYGLIHLVSLLF